ncbi:hypothetical protein [Deinococcus roseus]|uniref:Uncharacterized protein n=1 Tax=Deinococcus roseus TaxID=392414 RepID=A0ABQ2CX70_9DEIO|nr:hypothetical protein [Deinococcus roseus]GGJ22965.1 hypothetical protein GCM10008938_06460 [Deinococcus roseus]
MISIRQTLLDVLLLLVRRPLTLFWALVTGLMISLSGELLLASGAAALQRYLVSALRGEKSQKFHWEGVFTIPHLLLSVMFMAFSFVGVAFFGGMHIALDMLGNTFIAAVFLYSFLLARADLTLAQILQKNAELIRKGDLWKHVALLFLWSFLQYLAGKLIPRPDLNFENMMDISVQQAEQLLQFLLLYMLFLWIIYVLGSLVVASWYHQLTDPAKQKKVLLNERTE